MGKGKSTKWLYSANFFLQPNVFCFNDVYKNRRCLSFYSYSPPPLKFTESIITRFRDKRIERRFVDITCIVTELAA